MRRLRRSDLFRLFWFAKKLNDDFKKPCLQTAKDFQFMPVLYNLRHTTVSPAGRRSWSFSFSSVLKEKIYIYIYFFINFLIFFPFNSKQFLELCAVVITTWCQLDIFACKLHWFSARYSCL